MQTDYNLIERLVKENLELDFATEHPNTVLGGDSATIAVGQVEVESNPDIIYLNALCTQIQQKLQNIQQISGNLTQDANCGNVIKGTISTLMNMETECDYVLGDLNTMSDTMNNMAINPQSMQGIVIDGSNIYS